MEGDLEADCDSEMLLISLCYGKQTVISEDRGRQESASADGVVGPAFDTEIILTDVEQAQHVMTYDLGLAETDAGWLTFAAVRVMKNMRTRSQQAENRRQRDSKKRMSRTSRTEKIKEKRKERRDSVPPLKRDTFRNTDTRARSRERSMSRNPGQDRTQSRQPGTPPRPPPGRTPSPRRTTEQAQSSGYRRGTTPPWCEHERGRDDRRQRSETPPTRSTRSRTENRSNQGASWTHTGRQARRDIPNVPEPPAPPRRQTGAQWLNSGSWQNTPEPPQTNRNTGRCYFQPPYYRQNPNISAVEYICLATSFLWSDGSGTETKHG